MAAMTMPLHVYSCHFCNSMMLMLSFLPVKALHLASVKKHIHTRAFLGEKVDNIMHLYDRGREVLVVLLMPWMRGRDVSVALRLGSPCILREVTP